MTYYKYPVIMEDDDSLVDLANNMGIEDLCKLINIFRDRICVFDAKNKIVHELRDTTEYFSACLNGAGIQLSVNDGEVEEVEVEDIPEKDDDGVPL
jgi:hypothetical protein